MCIMCEGATIEQVRQNLYEQICTDGYAMVPVGNGWDRYGWAYTIGLADAHDHPELVIIGARLGDAVVLLDEVARRVIQGCRFDAGDAAVAVNTLVGFVDVHPVHFRAGLLNGWFDYYHAAGRRDLAVRALQVVQPGTQPRLDCDHHVPFYGQNRAARRTHSSRSE
jgi:hypothetical protein